jgi:hypothetical protein
MASLRARAGSIDVKAGALVPVYEVLGLRVDASETRGGGLPSPGDKVEPVAITLTLLVGVVKCAR